MRVRILLVLALAAAVGFAPAPFPKKERRSSRDDLEAMQGLWRMTAYESGGSPVGHNYKVRIRNNRWTFISLDGNQERETASYIYTLEYRVSPRAFEWRSTRESNSGWVGSYRLDGRKLTIVFGTGTLKQVGTRPVDFNGKPSYRMVLEFIGRE